MKIPTFLKILAIVTFVFFVLFLAVGLANSVQFTLDLVGIDLTIAFVFGIIAIVPYGLYRAFIRKPHLSAGALLVLCRSRRSITLRRFGQ